MKIAVTVALVGVLLAAGACEGTRYDSGSSDGRPTGQYGSRDTEVRGTGGREMTVEAPRRVVLARGAQAPLQVGIDRERFRGPVIVSLTNLPSGVRADDARMKVETTEATFILKASKTADLVRNHAATVRVEGPDGMAASQYVDITVHD